MKPAARHSSSSACWQLGLKYSPPALALSILGQQEHLLLPLPAPHTSGLGEKSSIPWDSNSAPLWMKELCDLGVAEGRAAGAGLGGTLSSHFWGL